MRDLLSEYEFLIEIGNTKLEDHEYSVSKKFTGFVGYPEVTTSKKTSHTVYKGVTTHEKEKHHPDHSGINHDVSWSANHNNPDSMSDHDKKKTLSHALALHQKYIDNHTSVGDVVTNTPIKNKENSGKNTQHNKREHIYSKKAGFATPKNKNIPDYHENRQFGIVRQHADDHPEEHKRGKKYLEPLDNPNFDERHSPIAKTLSHRKILNTKVD